MSDAKTAILFAALYLSEGWYDRWHRTGSVHSKARAMVLFDRVITGRLLKLPNGEKQ